LIEEEHVKAHHVSLVGDSAGAALVVLVLIRIKQLRLPKPACTALLSPWCDFKDSFSSKYGACDYISQETLVMMGNLVLAKSSERQTSSINPIDLVHAIPRRIPILIQAGDSETLFHQIRRFTDLLIKHDLPVTYKVYHEMIHVPHFFFLVHKSGESAICDLCMFVNSHTL
jgi:acetyl esterase/lipase